MTGCRKQEKKVYIFAANDYHMKTIIILLLIAAFLFIYNQFIYKDPDLLDHEGNVVHKRKGKV